MKKYTDLEKRLQIYTRVKRLRDIGLSYDQIQKIIKKEYGTSLSKGVIGSWLRGESHPLGGCNKIIEGPELAYAISGWLGDGGLACIKSRHQYIIKLPVSDYDFAKEWGRCLAQALSRSKPYEPKWDKSHQRWVTQGYSRILYDLLKRAKDDPWILMPYLEKYPADACRGFFDAEGGAYSSRYRIEAYNTDIRIIEMFKKLLENIGISANICQKPYKDREIKTRHHKAYQRKKEVCHVLTIYGKENILRFAERVGFTIVRKRLELQQILQKYMSLKIPNGSSEKCARVLIATNLVRLGLVKRQSEAARMLSVTKSSVCNCLHNRTKISKLQELPEIEQLSREYFHFRSDEVIKKVRKILETMAENI